MLILGIETSCDETAAAVVGEGRRLLSSVVASQVAVHQPYGGVVPELASRKHMESIVPVVHQAIGDAGISLADVQGIAVTQGPGLVGALLVGFSFAKSLAMTLKLPLIGVNHLEGHIHSVFFAETPPSYPFVVLLASGGHTNLYHVTGPLRYELMGQSRDDAAGEAFDKVAKMLGLGYPGGGVISRLAEHGDPDKIKFPRPYVDKAHFDFSFSGIKTAVNRYIQKNTPDRTQMADIAAGFQESVVEVLAYKAMHAVDVKRCANLALVGGVAANGRLRETVLRDAAEKGVAVCLPPLNLCGDNAVMIAAAGYHHLKAGHRTGMDEDVYSRMPITN